MNIKYQQVRASGYKKNLKRKATRAEKVLMRKFNELGIDFTFQACFFDCKTLYIVDFKIPSKNFYSLIVELDGGYHNNRGAYDNRRTEWLERKRNCKVIRFRNEEIFKNLDNVASQILSHNPIARVDNRKVCLDENGEPCIRIVA